MSPIRVNVNVLYRFFETFYPRFINDQQNVLDIIISKVEKKQRVLGLYLYETKKVGIHETISTLPKDLIRSKNIDLENLDNFFNKLQVEVMKKTDIRISSIRVFKKEAIDLIDNHCKDIRKLSFQEFIPQILDLIQTFFKRNLFLIYPKPMFQSFFLGSIKLLDNIRFKDIFNFLESLLPEFKFSIILSSDNIEIVFLLQKRAIKSGKSEISCKILTLDEIGIDLKNDDLKNKLKLIQEKLKVEEVYYLNQQDLISVILDIFELGIPIKKENIQFLIQKLLFGYRSFERLWEMVPRPIIYHNFIRFIIRLLGFNLNLKKLSHWAIPDLIFNFIDFYFGLNCKILIMITDIKKHSRLKSNHVNYLKSVTEHSYLLEVEKSTLTKLESLNKTDLFPNNEIDSLDLIKMRISEKFGFISSVIVLDKLLLQNLIKSFIFKHGKLRPFSKLKTLKMLKNKVYFRMHPEIPPYQLIKGKRMLSLIKLTLPILIDKHEF